MGLRIRRGSDEARANTPLDQGELVWTSSQGTTGANYHQLWVGTGIGTGGVNILETSAGFGLAWDAETQRLEVSGLTADDVANGVNNKYFSTELAQDAAASLFTTGTHTNIQFQYDDNLGKINATVTLDGIGLTEIVEDDTPQLGGNLDLNDFNITGTGNINVTGDITLSGEFNNGVTSIVGSKFISTDLIGLTGNPAFEIGENLSLVAHSLIFNQPSGEPSLLSKNVAGSLDNASKIQFLGYGTSLAVPTRLETGNSIGGISFSAFEPSTEAVIPTALIVGKVDPNGIVSDTLVNGKLEFLTGSGTSSFSIKYLTFDSQGQLAVNHQNAQATLDVNGFAKLAVLTAAPPSPANGMIAIADGTTWDPAGTGKSVMVVYLGGGWRVAATAP